MLDVLLKSAPIACLFFHREDYNMEYFALESTYPTLYPNNAPVPPPHVNGGWWHKASAALAGEVPKVDPTWSG
jgi:hypothetical protein